MTDRNQFGHDTTTEEVLEGIDLSGRTALVTGASGGLGAEAARALASRGAQVTLAARDAAKTKQLMAEIVAQHPEAQLEHCDLELSEPDKVRRCGETWLAQHDSLDMLILNAGLMACPLARTAEGWELQFATNHIGHFLLANLLTPALLKAAPSRVVVLSSGGHKISPVVFEDIHFQRRDYDPWSGYGQAKTANVLFAVEFDRRLRERDVRSFAVHPGMIPTDLGRHLTRESILQIRDRAKDSGEAPKALQAGAATEVWAATAPELEGLGGLYLADCGIGSPDGEGSRGHATYAVDPDAAARLWAVSEEMLGEAFAP
ncbi:SDR family NAD(P)-dependent oxidoreductase [Myxococcota bacterium]|nr:SDR family NAD(P)-dependent oxidoreductase [Myxococcota bacterium]